MKKEDLLYYNIFTQQIRENFNVPVLPLCNGFTVVNIGTTVAQVNGIPLSPPGAGSSIGESYSFGGNRGEVFAGRIDIIFPAGVGTGGVLVTQKQYIKQITAAPPDQLQIP